MEKARDRVQNAESWSSESVGRDYDQSTSQTGSATLSKREPTNRLGNMGSRTLGALGAPLTPLSFSWSIEAWSTQGRNYYSNHEFISTSAAYTLRTLCICVHNKPTPSLLCFLLNSIFNVTCVTSILSSLHSHQQPPGFFPNWLLMLIYCPHLTMNFAQHLVTIFFQNMAFSNAITSTTMINGLIASFPYVASWKFHLCVFER